MRESIEMPKGIFYIIVGLCAAIIMLTSIDMLLRTKDTEIFNMWLSNPNFTPEFLGRPEQELYSEYIQMCVSTFIVRVITPMAVVIHTYFTFTKLRVNKLYVIIWVLLLLGSFALAIIGEQFYSIFFIGSGIGYLALIIMMIYLGKCIYDVRSI